jgi:hypothetical protein
MRRGIQCSFLDKALSSDGVCIPLCMASDSATWRAAGGVTRDAWIQLQKSTLHRTGSDPWIQLQKTTLHRTGTGTSEPI